MKGRRNSVIEHLGHVEAINVLSIVVSFSPPEAGEAITLPGGVEIPAGVDYGWVYYQPSLDQAARHT